MSLLHILRMKMRFYINLFQICQTIHIDDIRGVHFAPHVKNAPKFHRIYKIARKRFLQNFKIRLFFQKFWTPLKIGTEEKIGKNYFLSVF